MKNFLITVNGKTYEVHVEEIEENAAPKVTPLPSPTIPKPEVKPLSAGANVGAVGKTIIKCPMPGTIVKIKVKIGDLVKSGTILCILEAMKMENEILAPGEGVVFSVNATHGASVNAGDILFTIN